MPVRGLILLSLLALAACQTGSSRPQISAGAVGPADAILAAANAAPRRVPGTFELQVRGSGRQDGNIYLNSEKDYRDQRSISIAIHPMACAELRERLGGWPDEVLAGKTIRVRGAARRARIDFIGDNGRPSGKYYYQTHVDVTHANQITVVG